jgi:hypothetical protein
MIPGLPSLLMRWLSPLLGAGLLVVSIFAGITYAQKLVAQKERAEAIAARAQDRQEHERMARIANDNYRAEEERRRKAYQEKLDETNHQLDVARADAVAAAGAGSRLRDRVKQLAAACRGPAAGDSAVAAAGQAASSPGDLLAFVSGRIDEAAGVLAETAQQARVRGGACEAIHDSLNAQPARQ